MDPIPFYPKSWNAAIDEAIGVVETWMAPIPPAVLVEMLEGLHRPEPSPNYWPGDYTSPGLLTA